MIVTWELLLQLEFQLTKLSVIPLPCRFRPQFIHKYTLNSQSIYSAVSVGLSGHLILKKLSIFSKLEIPRSVEKFVTMTAEACGKVQMALSKGRYYLESVSKDALLVLLREPGGLVVEAARKVLGGARLSPEELIKSVQTAVCLTDFPFLLFTLADASFSMALFVLFCRWKEVSYNAERESAQADLSQLEADVTAGQRSSSQLFNAETLKEVENFVLGIFRRNSNTAPAGSSAPKVSLDFVIEHVFDRFESPVVKDVKSTLQLLERALEDVHVEEIYSFRNDVRRRLLSVQAEANSSSSLNINRRRVWYFEASTFALRFSHLVAAT